MEIPEEKVYSVRLKECTHRTIMERLESGIPQHIITEALIHYFAAEELQAPAQFDLIMEQLVELRSLIESRVTCSSEPELLAIQSESAGTQSKSSTPATDPLADEVANSILDLLIP